MFYILLGPDVYARDARLRVLLGNREAETIWSSQGMEPWLTAVGQAGLFEEAKPVVGRDQLGNLPTEDLERLLDHIELYVDSSELIVLLGMSEEVGIEHTVLKKATIEKFAMPSQGQLLGWLRKEAERVNLAIEPNQLSKIVELLGGNRYAMEQQLLMWQLQGLKKITGVEVDDMAWLAADASIFGLTDSWAKRQLTVALQELDWLMSQGISTGQIIAMLGWQAELLRAASLTDKGTYKAFKPMAVDKAGRLIRQWPEGAIDEAMLDLAELDGLIKTGKIEDRLGLELWLCQTINPD